MSNGVCVAKSSPTQVVCDAGPIIHLDELSCLDLLADFAPILVPGSVWQEVSHHRPNALAQGESQFARAQITLSDDIELLTLLRALALDAGEQEALVLMRRHPEAILLTDDAAARLVAEQWGLRVHGTIGVLVRAIRTDARTPTEILSVLRLLPQRSTLYIRPSLLNKIITQIQTEFDLD